MQLQKEISEDDRSRIESITGINTNEELVVFDGSKASTVTKSMCFTVRLTNSWGVERFGIPNSRLRSIFGMMPPGKMNVSIKGAQISFKSGDTLRTTSIVPIEDFDCYDIPMGDDTEDCIIEDAESFSDSIKFASHFTHKDVFIPIHSTFILMLGNSAKIYGSNGITLGLKDYKQKTKLPEKNIMIAGEHIGCIAKICEGQKNAVLSVDETGKFCISTKIGILVCLQHTGGFVDLIANINKVCAIQSDFSKSPKATLFSIESSKLKKALTHAISIFAKEEYPFLDMVFRDKVLTISANSLKNSDRFEVKIDSESSGEYKVRLSPVLLAKCASVLDGKVLSIAWNAGGDSKTQPICLVNNGMSRLTMMAPRLDVMEDA